MCHPSLRSAEAVHEGVVNVIGLSNPELSIDAREMVALVTGVTGVQDSVGLVS